MWKQCHKTSRGRFQVMFTTRDLSTCNNTRHLQNNSILKMVYHKETSTSSSTWEKIWEALLVAMKNSHQNVQCGWRTGQHQRHSSLSSYPTHKHGCTPFKWSLPSVIQAVMQSIQTNARMKWQWTNINWGLFSQLEVVEPYISLFRYYKDKGSDSQLSSYMQGWLWWRWWGGVG